MSAYVDFGPPTHRPKGHAEMVTPQWRNRPHCDLCGPFRGRFLRIAGRDEFGPVYRCERCDWEDQ